MKTNQESVAYGKAVVFQVSTPLSFADFKLIYLGKKSKKEEPTVSIATDSFSLIQNDGTEQTIKIVSGQLPPKPISFVVNGDTFELRTFSLPDGSRLRPNELAIFKLAIVKNK